jgi:hypothetical protein
MILSPGQIRLRELVTEAAADIDPAAWWEEPPTLPVLAALRERVLSDTTVTEDERTGVDLRAPSVPATYVEIQQMLFPAHRAPEVRVAADHLLFAHIDIHDPSIAAAGANKWSTTYGALTHFAHGRKLYIAVESPPTILSGSSVIAVGSGSNHRTLASFLWGEASFGHYAGIKIVEDKLDLPLWRACERLEIFAPVNIRRFGIFLDWNAGGTENRRRVMALSERVKHDQRLASALEARWKAPSGPSSSGTPTLRELEAL